MSRRRRSRSPRCEAGSIYLRLDVSNLFDDISNCKRGKMLVMLYDEVALEKLNSRHHDIMEKKGMLQLLREYAVKHDATNEELLQHLQAVRNKFQKTLPSKSPLNYPQEMVEETLEALRTEAEADFVTSLMQVNLL